MGTVSQLMGTVSQLMGTVSQLIGTVSQLIGTVSQLIGTVSQLIGTVSQLIGVVYLKAFIKFIPILCEAAYNALRLKPGATQTKPVLSTTRYANTG
jgi:hypothetical protein